MRFSEKFSLLLIIPAASVASVFITPELKLIQNHFSLSTNILGQVMSYYLAGYLLGQFFFASLSKNIGLKNAIRIGALSSMLAMLLQINAVHHLDYKLFIIGRFLTAFGLSAGIVCGFAAIKEKLSAAAERSFLSIVTVTFTSSIYFAILFSGHLQKSLNIDSILIVNLFYVAAIFGLANFIRPPLPTNNIKAPEITAEADPNYLKLITYSICLSISTIFAYCYSLYAPMIMIQNFNLTPATFSNYNLLNLLAIFIGSYLFIKLAKVFTEETMVIISMFLLIIGGISYLLISDHSSEISLPLFIVTTFFVNIVCGLIYPAATYKALEYGKCKKSTSATMNSIKIGMPTLAIFVMGYNNLDSFSKLAYTLLIFSTIFTIFLVKSR